MNGWKRTTMAEVMLEFYDGPHATPAEADSGPVYLGIKNITDSGALDLSDYRPISEEDFAHWTRRVEPRPNDVVFTYEATLHRYALIPQGFRGCLGRRIALIRPDTTKVVPRYLHYAMLGPGWRNTVTERIISGSTVDRIPIKTFPTFPISIPPLATQQKIVDVLGSIDDLIANNRRRIEVLEEMAQAIYREWFVHLRFPGHEDATFVDSPLGLIPEGWQTYKTSDLIKAGRLEIGDGYRAKNAELIGDKSDLPFVRVANVRNGSLVLDGCDYLPLSYRDRLKGKVSRAGDSVISMKGTVGRSAFVDEHTRPLVYSPQVSYWRSCDAERIAPTFLYAFIRSDAFVQQCAVVKGSTDMADYVNLTDQRNMTLILPTGTEIAAFDRSAGEALRLASRLRDESTNLSAIRDLLLPRLVTGDVDMSQLDLGALVGAS